jgi:bifunctional non-homologous end joining protein LigD
VEDHPLDYGDFEGTIPKGQYGGGNHATAVYRGYWHPQGELDPEAQLEKGELKFRLEGQRLGGSWVIVRMKNDRDTANAQTGCLSSIETNTQEMRLPWKRR